MGKNGRKCTAADDAYQPTFVRLHGEDEWSTGEGGLRLDLLTPEHEPFAN